MKLYDTIPVANTAEINVTLTGDLPSLKDLEHKQGVHAWIREVSAAGQVEVNYGYSLSYPQDQSLSGL